ncbi:class I tRNA ligase family protein [Candidatus Vidania fulgoroideorum]
MNIKYNHKKIEKYNIEKKKSKQKQYCISMIPYPSGNLHLGHIRNYTINDVICRKIGIKMFMGWDSFGLPAENYSIKKDTKTSICVKKNIKSMKKVMKKMGFNIDWSREINTSNSSFYKYTQEIFLILHKNGYIYRSKFLSYWDKIDNTVLSKEQAYKGKGWRSEYKVTKKIVKSYFIRLSSSLINSILKDLKKSKWPKSVIYKQKNWIGKKKGFLENKIFAEKSKTFEILEISFNNKHFINIFENINYVSKYFIKKPHKFENIKYKYFLGYKNFKGKNIPLFANNKLEYNKYYYSSKINPFDNFEFIRKFKKKICLGFKIKKKKKTIFKILDWNISRQRYWGTPIPLFKCSNCGIVREKISNLPIKIKKNKKIRDLSIKSFYTICRKCKKKALRETETLDTFFDSSWYFLAYSGKKLSYKESKMIDVYIGGEEHTILHLLFSRIIIKILNKLGKIKFSEPFKKLIIQGLVLNEAYYYLKDKKKVWVENKNVKKKYNKIIETKYKKYNVISEGIIKMSKSKKNGIDPKEYIDKYGVDSLRMYIMFISPINKSFVWNNIKIIGCYRFIKKVWTFLINYNTYKNKTISKNKLLKIKNMEKNIKILYENYKFNIVISKLMTIFKILKKIRSKNISIEKRIIKFIKYLNPICPYITNMLCMILGFNKKYNL